MADSLQCLVEPEGIHEGDGETVEQEAEVNMATNSTTVCCCDTSTRKFASLGYMAICLLLGVVFLVAGKVRTDGTASHVNEEQVYLYLTIMLTVAIAWMAISMLSRHIPDICSKIQEGWLKKHERWLRKCERWLEKHEESAKPLIPSRLLVGVMFFGLGSSFMTMVEFLEYATGSECPSRDPTMLCYYFLRTFFIYIQLYFFYKLSGRSKPKTLICSHFMIMHLIALNLATWIVSFVHESTEELREGHGPNSSKTEQLELFMVRNWGSLLANNQTNQTENCRKREEDLKLTAEKMAPYFYTFTMEYCLLSAGLLLNVWLSLRGGITEESNDHEGQSEIETDLSAAEGRFMHGDWEVLGLDEGVLEVGTLWRFGFILGLVYVPAFAAMIFNIMFTDTEDEDKLIYVGFQLFFFMSVLIVCVFGCRQLERQEKGKIHSKVDFYLLGGALVGVFFLDMFIIIAAICEIRESPSIAVLLLITNICELACSVTFTHFVHKALERKLPSEKKDAVLDSASKIREVVSFLFMLNLCFWVMYTFEVKKSEKVVELAKTFYTTKVWFYISHIVYPLAVFFHFHGAVCMVEILNLYSKVPMKGIPSTSSVKGSHHRAVQT